MQSKSLSLITGLILAAGCIFPVAAVWAQARDDAAGPTAEQKADWERRLQEAKQKQEHGAARQEESKQAFEDRKLECFKKFRVTACQHEAKQQYIKATEDARRIENEGKALEREVKKEQLADKDARRIAKEPQREADLRAREAETRAERQQAEENRAAKTAEKEQQMQAGAQRNAAAEERRRKKQEDHERNVAEKMERARLREAESAR